MKEVNRDNYFRRSRRAAWWVAGISAMFGTWVALAGQAAAAAVPLTIALFFFLWGLDYNWRISGSARGETVAGAPRS